MSRKIKTVNSFKYKSRFEEFAKIFDSKEADLRHTEFIIKPLFRGFFKDDPKKIILYIMLGDKFKSLFKKIVNGLKVTNLISQL